jgi:hypothetical protein
MLADRGVRIREDAVDRLEGKGTALARIVFKDAGYLERDALFCHPAPRSPSIKSFFVRDPDPPPR